MDRELDAVHPVEIGSFVLNTSMGVVRKLIAEQDLAPLDAHPATVGS